MLSLTDVTVGYTRADVLHGVTVTPVMRYLDRRAGRTPPGEGAADKDDAEPTEEGQPAPAPAE